MISSPYNPLIKHLVKLRKNRDYREDKASLVLSSQTLVEEIGKIIKPKVILSSSPHLPSSLDAEHFEITTKEILCKITGLKNFDGLIAEFPLPPASSLLGKKWILGFDKIGDPGNLGTLIRSATAFGWEGLFFLPHTVDPFNEKVVRSSRGALFHTPYTHGTWEELKELTQDLPCFVADIKGANLNQINLPEKALLILSNEAQGPSKEALKLSQPITIPMPGKIESLNVAIAGGILLYMLKRGQ